MGGALVATRSPDASAIAYNPATMTQIESASILVGSSLIAPKFEVERAGSPYTNKSQLFVVPHAYGVAKAADKVWLGIGEFTRFGLGTRYNDSWAGKASLYDVQLTTVEAQPTVAFQATEDLSIGVGVELFYGNLDIRQIIPSPPLPTPSDVRMDADGFGVGATLSAFYKFNDQWAAGFVYRSPLKLHGEGRLRASPNIPAAGLNDGRVTMDASLPSSYTLGVSYMPTEDWSVELDVIHTRWEHYKKLEFGFPDGFLGNTSSDKYKYWKNTWRVQLGTEYAATDWLDLRAGYIWDQSPIRSGYEDYMLPANDRMLFSGGLGFHFLDNWTVDASYIYLKGKGRKGVKIQEITGGPIVNCDFKSSYANIGALSIGYEF